MRRAFAPSTSQAPTPLIDPPPRAAPSVANDNDADVWRHLARVLSSAAAREFYARVVRSLHLAELAVGVALVWAVCLVTGAFR